LLDSCGNLDVWRRLVMTFAAGSRSLWLKKEQGGDSQCPKNVIARNVLTGITSSLELSR
jgi:hypothetical protein